MAPTEPRDSPRPEHALAFDQQLRLGYTAMDQRDFDVAWDHFQAVLDLAPGFAPAWLMLGNLALLAQDAALALEYYQQVRRLDPEEAGVWLSIAQARAELGQAKAVCEAYAAYLLAHPQDAEIWLRLAQAYQRIYWTRHEADCLERYLTLRPADALSRRWLGMVRFYHGAWDWLEGYYAEQLGSAAKSEPGVRRLLELDYLRYLFTDPQTDDAALFAWMRRCHTSEPPQWRRPIASRSSGPLRIGYLSAEFGNFASALLVWPLYLHHSQAVKVYLYDDTEPEAEARDFDFARAIRRRINGLDDQAVADWITADGIDVLVDLTGITHQRRHGLYALHPAPAQVSGLGFVFSSGLACMDYCFSDRVLCPPHIEALYPETVIHLNSAFHWQPPEPFALTDPPLLRNRYITFGAAHTLNRLRPEVVALWARILQRVPDSRLFLKTAVLADPLTQSEFRARFAAHGIDPARLRLEGHGQDQHMPYFYPQIDIALDPFPYSGGVTTSEALFMGVPVLVMDQPQWRSRALSVSIYTSLGLADWLTHNEDDYLNRAVGWAADPDLLCRQRQALRPRLLNSVICDGPAYAREIEAACVRIRARA